MTDTTERGLVGVLEERLASAQKRSDHYAAGFRQSGHRLVHPDEERALLAVALAAERRRQAKAAIYAHGRDADVYITFERLYRQAMKDEDAALEALAAHLAGDAS